MRKNDVDIPNKKENDGNVNDWLSGGTIGQKGAVLVFRSCVLAEKKSNEAPTKTIGSNTGNTILLKKAQNMAKRLAADPGALPFEAHVRSRNLMHDVIETFGSCEMTSTNAYIVRHMSDDELSRVESVEEQGHEVYGCCIKDVAVLPNKLCNNKFKKPADHDKDEKNHKKTKANTKSIVPITPYYASPAMNVKVLDSARMPSRVLNITYKLVNTETKLLHKLLQAHGLREAAADSKDFNLMWSGTHPKPDVLRSLMPFQRVNRLPRSYELTRKDKLFKNIEKMQYFRGVKHFDFIPNTFLMPSEFNELCSTHYRTKGPWIVKPAASCCGRGIYIVNNPDQIPKDENVVVAKYIDRPLLIGGHKCDLRLYVCVTSVDPLLIYLYEEGLVRFATVKYDTSNKNLWNPCMHLCNYSINKYHTDYIKCTDPNVGDIGHKWTLSALLRHLREAGLNTIGLMADIEDLIVKSILSSAHTIASAARAFMPYWFNCFELFGFDILIDENLKPWLLEINLSPSLACESPLDARIKSSMLADTLTLVGLPAASMFSDKIAVPKSKTAAQNQNDYSADGATMRKNGAAVSGTGYCSLPYLTGDDNRLVRAVKAQYTRKGGYVRIFPSQNSWQKYSQFLDPVTGIPIYSSTLNYNIPYHGISHNYNLLIHTQLIPHFQDSVSNGTEQSPQRLKRYEVVSVAAAAPAVSLSDPTMSLRDARQAKELVKHQLREGLKLTTGEVRRAFGLYLTHVLKRISSPHNDVNATHAQLVLRFLGRAASTLRMPYNVKGPPAKICDKDRYAIISKLLNDFLFKYYKETDLFTDTEDREGCISNINFAAFLYSASEADLEDVLLLILRLENFNTVFLGDTRNQYCIDLPPSRLAVSDPPTRHTLLRHLASVTPFNVRKYRPICYNNEAFRRQQGMMLKHKEQPVTPVYNMSYFQTMYN